MTAAPIEAPDVRRERWQRAQRILSLVAVDPWGLGGAHVRASAGPARDAFLARLRTLAAARDAPVLTVSPGITDDRLLGGLELAETLGAARPVFAPGLLARANGGFLLLQGAERASAALAARLCLPLDAGRASLPAARNGDGASDHSTPARFALMAIDEGEAEAAGLPGALADRLAFQVSLDGLALADLAPAPLEPADDARRALAEARDRLLAVTAPDAIVTALCEASLALGIASPRAVILALRAARAVAAIAGSGEIDEAAAVEAVRLVLAHRATQRPEVTPQDEQAPDQPGEDGSPPERPPEPPADTADGGNASERSPPASAAELAELLIAAIAAELPLSLLDGADTLRTPRSGEGGDGSASSRRIGLRRGRQIGVRRGLPRGGARLDILATLQAAAPWQRLRGGGLRSPKPPEISGDARKPLAIYRDDFRLRRFEEPARTLTIFAVDASGSAALHRLAEAKGAVELLLADCYVRRDHVALIAFRGSRSEIVLPPTRSPARAKRLLSGLPGGGGTPLADAILTALTLAEEARRRGQSVTLVLLTDARANVTLDGIGGRAGAEADARRIALDPRLRRHRVVLIDTSPRPNAFARELAAAMAARYVALPHSTAQTIAAAVQVESPDKPARRA